MKYAVVIERTPANYGAYVPDLPGCIATGATKDEVLHNIHEAIEMHLEALREDRQPLPDATTIVAEVEAR